MNFLEQNESAEDRTKLYMENNPSLKLRSELLLSWLKDVGEVDEDTTLEDVIFVGDFYDLDRFSGVLSFGGMIHLLTSKGPYIAQWGAWFSSLTLLMLIFGQRITKDYSGAATLVPYFIVSLIGLFSLTMQFNLLVH